MREANILNRLSVLREKASGRMMKLQEKIWVAVAFQKLRENRKQVHDPRPHPTGSVQPTPGLPSFKKRGIPGSCSGASLSLSGRRGGIYKGRR